MRYVLFTIVIASVLISPSRCLDNGLGLTPALGYNTW